MSSKQLLNILVIPDLFPMNEDDLAGIFILDWIECLKDTCRFQVFYPRLSGSTKGVRHTTFHGQDVTHFRLLNKRVPSWLRPARYAQMVNESVKIATGFKDVDIIHAHGPAIQANLAVKLGKRIGRPVVITVHTGPFSQISSSRPKLRVAKKALEAADVVTCVSEHLAKEIQQSGIRPKRLEVLGNPVDTELFHPAKGPRPMNMLFVSRLDEFKGGLRTLIAFDKVKEELPEWTLTIGGDGEEYNAIKQYLDQRNLSDRVKMLGRLNKAEVAKVMQGAAFLIFPSLHESFGLVAAEALACGIPVIGTDRTAPQEYLNLKNSITVDPMNVEEIAKAMKKMATDHRQFEPNGVRASIEQKFGFKAFGQRLNEVYRSI